ICKRLRRGSKGPRFALPAIYALPVCSLDPASFSHLNQLRVDGGLGKRRQDERGQDAGDGRIDQESAVERGTDGEVFPQYFRDDQGEDQGGGKRNGHAEAAAVASMLNEARL